MSRRRARAACLSSVFLTVVLTASPAFAFDNDLGPREGADPGRGLSAGVTIVLFVVVPAAILFVIAALVWLPGMVKADRYRPQKGWAAAPVWFAGPPTRLRLSRLQSWASATGVVQVAAGSAVGLPVRIQERIEQDLQKIRDENGLDVSVLVGDLDLEELSHFRGGAERLHAALGQRSAEAVLLVVAPGQRKVEVVTGTGVRRRVPDRVCALAVLSMTTAFTGGDLGGGITEGLRQIADSAGHHDALSPAATQHHELALRADAEHGRAPGAGHDQVQSTRSH